MNQSTSLALYMPSQPAHDGTGGLDKPLSHTIISPVNAHPIRHLLFALLLLIAQQLAVVHPLSHLASPAQKSAIQEGHEPGALSCDQCLALSPLGAGLGNALAPGLNAPFEHVRNLADMFATFLPAGHRPFDSRAPPSR